MCRIFLPCGMLHNRVVFEFLMFVYSFLNISFIHACMYAKKNLNFNSRQGGKNRFYSFHHDDEQKKKKIRCLAIAFRYSITNNLTHFYINIFSVYEEGREERGKAHRNPF